MAKKNGRPIISGPEDIMRITGGYKLSRIILSAFDLGIFSAIGNGSSDSETIALKVGADPRATDRLLNALVAAGLIKKDKGHFFNSEVSARYLSQDSPDYMQGLGHASNLYRSWAHLTESVKRGSSSWNGAREEWSDESRESFIAAMHHRAMNTAREDIARIDLDGVRRVLDVGGGSGVYSMAFVRSADGLKAVVFDLPAIIKITERYINEAGMSDRITTVAGDYRTDEFGTGYDLIYLSAVIHINNYSQNVKLIQKAYNALNPGGKIVINDFIMNDDRTSPARGAIFALNMLVNTKSGDVYTEGEVREWLAGAGCTKVERVNTSPETAYMIGTKPR